VLVLLIRVLVPSSARASSTWRSPHRARCALVIAGALVTTLLLGLIGPVFGLIMRFNRTTDTPSAR